MIFNSNVSRWAFGIVNAAKYFSEQYVTILYTVETTGAMVQRSATASKTNECHEQPDRDEDGTSQFDKLTKGFIAGDVEQSDRAWITNEPYSETQQTHTCQLKQTHIVTMATNVIASLCIWLDFELWRPVRYKGIVQTVCLLVMTFKQSAAPGLSKHSTIIDFINISEIYIDKYKNDWDMTESGPSLVQLFMSVLYVQCSSLFKFITLSDTGVHG